MAVELLEPVGVMLVRKESETASTFANEVRMYILTLLIPLGQWAMWCQRDICLSYEFVKSNSAGNQKLEIVEMTGQFMFCLA